MSMPISPDTEAVVRTLVDEVTQLRRDLTSLRDDLYAYTNRQAAPATASVWLGELEEPAATTAPQLVLTADQTKAWSKLEQWFKSDQPFFVFKGVAGSGKTTVMKKVEGLPYNIMFTAPTNKATKVLEDAVGTQCSTIYSLLGYRMGAGEDEVLKLSKHQLKELGKNPIVVIDEAGMLPKFLVDDLLELNAERGIRFILVGDPYQLNPVGEAISSAWRVPTASSSRVMMREVKRFDNELLALSITLRQQIKDKNYTPIREENNDGAQGVFLENRRWLERHLAKQDAAYWTTRKIACWRNRTVDKYNDLIRAALGYTKPYVPGELVLVGSPVQQDNRIIAYIDEELEIQTVTDSVVTIYDKEIHVYDMAVKGKTFRLKVPKEPSVVTALLAELAAAAKTCAQRERKDAWSRFWAVKQTFHTLRYGYALTVHRLQGSTVDTLFLDQTDVLSNGDQAEAWRMLYVAATRPSKKLVVC